MIPFEVIGLTCEAHDHPSIQVGNLVRGLTAHVHEAGPETVLAVTCFVDARTPSGYRQSKALVLDKLRAAFGPALPPVSVVAQPPEGGMSVALEAVVLVPGSAAATVSRREIGGVPYTLLTSGETRQIHAGGISGGDGEADTAHQAEVAFRKMEAILDAEGLSYGQVVRQWNYLTEMLEVRGACQIYQAFNDVRTLAYSKSEFPHGYPAATGIGQQTGGIVIEFIALSAPGDVRIEARSNPAQIDAHRYSEEVLVGAPIEDLDGKSSPKFERAKMVAQGGEEVIFVSGTASIIGEESIAIGDVRAQTMTTLDNISALIDGGKPTWLRAYVKNAEDIPLVRDVCNVVYGDVPALFVKADVCRKELLVEIEGVRISR